MITGGEIRIQRRNLYATDPFRTITADLEDEERDELEDAISEAVHEVVEKDRFELEDMGRNTGDNSE